MKKLNSFLKISGLILMVSFLVSSCLKSKDPYADYTPEREAGLISDWLTTMQSRNKNIDTTSTGLYYIVDKTGAGPTVQAGDTVTVRYVGMYLNGNVFDASAFHTAAVGTSLPYFSADSTYTYVHQAPDSDKLAMIKGWEESIEVMNKGEKAAFLIPSAKAYGAYGYASIPPYTPLLFYIEVVGINNNR